MKNNKFISSIIILLIGGAISKSLGMMIKIAITRMIGSDGVGIYALVMPTFLLFITISQLGFPIAISMLVAEDKKNNKRLLFTSGLFLLFFNIFLVLIMLIISPYLSKYLLNETRTYYPLISISLVLPFIGISSVLRGYFFGKQKMIPHTLSNIFEQIIRFVIVLIITPILLQKNVTYAICGIILVNIISEISAIGIMSLFLPKNIKIKKEDLVIDTSNLKDILHISLPTTGSKLIGSITYFLEPIIITSVLLFLGYDSKFIVSEYGIISGYVIPLLLIPSFFTQAISQALLPLISKNYAMGNKVYIKNKLKQANCISFSIGLFISVILFLFPEVFLKMIFNTTSGVNYLRILIPFFLFHYLQGQYVAFLQGINKAKHSMMGTLYGAIIKTISLLLFSLLRIGLYGLIFATILNIVFVTIYDYLETKKALLF